jgi:hypothetical protein
MDHHIVCLCIMRSPFSRDSTEVVRNASYQFHHVILHTPFQTSIHRSRRRCSLAMFQVYPALSTPVFELALNKSSNIAHPPSSPSPSPTKIRSDHSDISIPQFPIPEGRYGDPPRTVCELAAWFDGKTKGGLKLEVLTWDGKIAKVPKNESLCAELMQSSKSHKCYLHYYI